jgi:triosephosphate isomerase
MNSSTDSTGRPLSERIAGLCRELQAAEQKAKRVHSAIENRRKTLHRLEALLVLQGGSGLARNDHECTDQRNTVR